MLPKFKQLQGTSSFGGKEQARFSATGGCRAPGRGITQSPSLWQDGVILDVLGRHGDQGTASVTGSAPALWAPCEGTQLPSELRGGGHGGAGSRQGAARGTQRSSAVVKKEVTVTLDGQRGQTPVPSCQRSACISLSAGLSAAVRGLWGRLVPELCLKGWSYELSAFPLQALINLGGTG